MSRLIHRRCLLGAGALIPAAATVGCKRRAPAEAGGSPCPHQARTSPPGHVLDAAQWETLRAACARLIPTDHEPGATEANVVGFIDSQLATPNLSTLKVELAAGLALLDRLARGQASTFAALAPEQQDKVLAKVQRGMRLEGVRQNSRHFFLVLLTLALEGFLCDPVYGGNRDEVGWKMVGLRMRPPRPRCPYRGRSA